MNIPDRYIEEALSTWMHLIGRNYLEDVMPQ